MLRVLPFLLCCCAAWAQTVIPLETARGVAEVPPQPAKIAVFDWAALDTLEQPGVPVGATTAKMEIDYLAPVFARAQTVGTVFEPDYEALARYQPDLVITGGPGANYENSLELLREYKKASNKPVITKSGLMVGLGEEIDEILAVMEDLRRHDVSMLTVGQYLQPSVHHLPVKHYYTPEQFQIFTDEGLKMGFTHVASGPMVRSSFHADMSAKAVLD